MTTETLNLSAYKGTTWNGFQMSITRNGTPLDLTGAELLMQLRKEAASSTVALEFSNEEGAEYSIQTNSVSSFSVDPAIIDISACNYDYDFRITLSDSTVLVPFKGTFAIIQNVSR